MLFQLDPLRLNIRAGRRGKDGAGRAASGRQILANATDN